ncbi:MAG: hypothetical protein EOP02_03805 [Proteobacteria bacterium]|nr:MAG: hypothetical protein EOP02_03805 [Pseudomonadota bacterium]
MKVHDPLAVLPTLEVSTMTYKPDFSSSTSLTEDSKNTPDERPINSTVGSKIDKEFGKATTQGAEMASDVKDSASNLKNQLKDDVSDIASDVKDQTTEIADEVKGPSSKVSQDVEQTTSQLADKVQQSGEKVIEATREYAQNAVDAAGKKVRQAQGQYESVKSTATDYIQEDPVRAVKVAAIGSAVLTAALIGIFRRR